MGKTGMLILLSSMVFCVTSCDSSSSSSASTVAPIYVPDPVLLANPLPEPSSTVSDFQDICDYVDYGVFNHLNHVDMTLDGYVIADLSKELAKIYWSAELVDINPEITCELNGNVLTINFSYRPIDKVVPAAQSPSYPHGIDAAYVTPVTTRTSDFEDFYYTKLPTKVGVQTSEQLWYTLQQGYQPLPAENSTADLLLEKAKGILRVIVDDSMTEMQKTLSIYDWMANNITYDYDVVDLAVDDATAALYDAYYLDGALNNYRAVCDGKSKLFVLLARMEGLECLRLIGPSKKEYYRPTIGSVGHAWNLIKVNGIWYTSDTTWSNVVVARDMPSIVSHNYFLTSVTKHDVNYDNYAYSDIECGKSYDYYRSTLYTIDGIEYDLVMQSKEELAAYFEFASKSTYVNLVGDVVLAFSFGDTFNDEIKYAITQSGWDISTPNTAIYGNHAYFMFDMP